MYYLEAKILDAKNGITVKGIILLAQMSQWANIKAWHVGFTMPPHLPGRKAVTVAWWPDQNGDFQEIGHNNLRNKHLLLITRLLFTAQMWK